MKIEFDGEFDNVYIYVADALRYDSVPERLTEQYQLVKTVSSSPVSASAFPSMATGLYPSQHGVYQFSDVMSPQIETMFDLFPGDSPFYFGVDIRSLSDREGITPYNDYDEFEARLGEIESPFFVMDRELITHDPYGHDVSGTHLSDDDKAFDSTEEYWQSRGNQTEAILEDYRSGAEMAVQRFERRMDVLRERGLRENTLVIFTADHGELLADRGFLQHGGGAPVYPELVYVPTLFCNEDVTVHGDFMGHVDLFPTVKALVDEPVPDELPGYDLERGAPDDRLVYSEIEHSFLGREPFKRRSVWGPNGGYVFTDQDAIDRFVAWARNFHPNYPARVWYRRHPVRLLKCYLRLQQKRGDPQFTRHRAKNVCEGIENRDGPRESADIDADAKERLKALGYSENDF